MNPGRAAGPVRRARPAGPGVRRRPPPGVCEVWTAHTCPEAGEAAVSLALQRLVVARATATAPTGVVLSRRCARCGGSDHGRPAVPAAAGRFDYSVAHSGGLVVVATVGAGRVGVDLELRPRGFDVVRLARLVCSEPERRWLAALDASARPAAMVSLWVRKEAVLKLLGLGMDGPWSRLDVRGPVVRFGPGAGLGPAAPRVHLTAVPPAVLGAGARGACAALATSRPLRLVVGRSPDPPASRDD